MLVAELTLNNVWTNENSHPAFHVLWTALTGMSSCDWVETTSDLQEITQTKEERYNGDYQRDSSN